MNTSLVDLFHRRLLSSNSATRVMEEWWGMPLRACKASVPSHSATLEQRARLQLVGEEALVHRPTLLYCGPALVAEADSWYRPDCLTEEMNHALTTTERPFGGVIAPLQPTRHTFFFTRHNAPFVLEHRSLLHTAHGLPFCEVHERFFPLPPPNTP